MELLLSFLFLIAAGMMICVAGGIFDLLDLNFGETLLVIGGAAIGIGFLALAIISIIAFIACVCIIL